MLVHLCSFFLLCATLIDFKCEVKVVLAGLLVLFSTRRPRGAPFPRAMRVFFHAASTRRAFSTRHACFFPRGVHAALLFHAPCVFSMSFFPFPTPLNAWTARVVHAARPITSPTRVLSPISYRVTHACSLPAQPMT